MWKLWKVCHNLYLRENWHYLQVERGDPTQITISRLFTKYFHTKHKQILEIQTDYSLQACIYDPPSHPQSSRYSNRFPFQLCSISAFLSSYLDAVFNTRRGGTSLAVALFCNLYKETFQNWRKTLSVLCKNMISTDELLNYIL